MKLKPSEVSSGEFYSYLIGSVNPRPIAFASTIDKQGKVNLSPYSFFNVFSANPPILVFSPTRRVRDNTTKHSYDNIIEVPEVVVNIVNFSIIDQMSLSSTEYEKGINEFTKSGLTQTPSDLISPPRVQESPVSYECKVIEVKDLGNEGGAGSLVICQVLLAHINDDILDENKKINPYKIDTVGRMGGGWYCRASGDGIFELPRPTKKGIGVDNIPDNIKYSKILTGNDLGRLGLIEALPNENEIKDFKESELKSVHDVYADDYSTLKHKIQTMAKEYLSENEIKKAWLALLSL